MPTIHIDGTEHEIAEGKNVLEVCLQLGCDLEYFCWHPAMGSVGACRQCAVVQYEDEDDEQGQLTMACMTPAKDGTRISIEASQAAEMRKSVIEFLMTNHPHDCPVCDEGGECHLQDMTVMSGHTYRRYRFNKRTYRNQYLGPFINHEMNRCIQCYRCVRFYRDYAGGRDLDVFGINGRTYFGREDDGVLESPFSGNLVEVCPTGVFTDKTLEKHYTRKWDLQTAPSVCHHCSAGCNTVPGERDGTLRRIRNRYNHEVNGYFICDRGRFGYEFVDGDARIRRPMIVRRENTSEGVSLSEIELYGEEALEQLTGVLEKAGGSIGVGSPRASLESNFALRRAVGEHNFYLGLSDAEHRTLSKAWEVLQAPPAPPASLQDAESADAVLVLGEDLLETAPRLGLSIRQAAKNRPLEAASEQGIPPWNAKASLEAIQDDRGPVYLATLRAGGLDDIARETHRAAPADIARLGFAVAAALDDDAPRPDGLSDEVARLADEIAEALAGADRPLVVAGTHAGEPAVIEAAANVARALRRREVAARLSLVVPGCNSLGLIMLGGKPLSEALDLARQQSFESVVVAENDLYRRAPAERIDRLLEAARRVVVLDHTRHKTAASADLVLPAATFADGSGTLVSHEGRAQRFFRVTTPEGPVGETWRWLAAALVEAGREEQEDWDRLDAVVARIAEAHAPLAGITDAAHEASFRIDGQRIARQPPRYSGRTALHADESVHERHTLPDPDSPLSFSMEGTREQPPADLVGYQWAPGWNSEQSLNKFQAEIAGEEPEGPAGKRLIEGADARGGYFDAPPAAFEARGDRLLAVPLYEIFGSEPLSAQAPAVSERVPEPYVALRPADAERLGLEAGDIYDVSLGAARFALSVRLDASLPEGCVGVSTGLPGAEATSALDWPVWVETPGGRDE